MAKGDPQWVQVARNPTKTALDDVDFDTLSNVELLDKLIKAHDGILHSTQKARNHHIPFVREAYVLNTEARRKQFSRLWKAILRRMEGEYP